VPPTPEAGVARALHAALLDLPVVIESVGCEVREVSLVSYPGGVRPACIVRVGEGRGESVAWTTAAHEAFRARLSAVLRGRWRIGAWAAAMAVRFRDPYERAALEGAAIDCALRQRGVRLGDLIGAEPRPARHVVSFEAVADPIARAADEGPDVQLKIDVDPGWDDGTLVALAALGRVAVLDFKLRGAAADAERAHAALPQALIEDAPGDGWSESLRSRTSFDAAITSAAALDALPIRPAAVNLKPARMGGVLEALACAVACDERGIPIYMGGMFEVGPARGQLAALAALLCPDAPNDIAPLVPRVAGAERRTPGFA